MESEDICELVKLHKDMSASGVATMALVALRFIRDNDPENWDAVTAGPAGEVIVTLWDYLKNKENPLG